MDTHGRPVRSLRISVTARCDLNCRYCHNEGQVPGTGEMSPEEIGIIARAARGLGITRVKLTGGEPLMRPDILSIVRACAEHMDEVSMTTNGIMLAPAAVALRDAGLARVNVSLDTLDRARYREITGHDRLDAVLEGIRAAVDAGLEPVKVNIVVQNGTTPREIMQTLAAIWDMGAMPQVIEVLGGEADGQMAYLENELAARAVRVNINPLHHRRIYMLDVPGLGEKPVELVRPMHNTEFCANCTRLRLTADGWLRPCLMHDRGMVDILTSIRRDRADMLPALFRQAVDNRHPYWTDETEMGK